MKADIATIYGPLEPGVTYELFYGDGRLTGVRKVHETPDHADWVTVGPLTAEGSALFICGTNPGDTTVFPISRPI